MHVLNIKIFFQGFAFILMEDPRDAEDAVKELDGTRMCGRRVKVQFNIYTFEFEESISREIKLDHISGLLITS